MAKAISGLASRFERASTTKNCRTILRVAGERGTGKTRLGLTGPAPIFYVSLDQGLEGVIEEFAAKKDIFVKDLEWHPGRQDFTQEYAQETRAAFEDAYYYALENGARTVVIDKETDLWELYRYAEFGGPSEAPKDYAQLNQRYIAMVNKAKQYPHVNLLLIQGMGDEWGSTTKIVNGQKKTSPISTGNRIPKGFNRIDELVFGEIMCHREGTAFYFDFKSATDPEYGKCRQNMQLSGQRLPAMPLHELGTFLIDGSEPEEWL